jgi:hypothetical protein
METSGDLWKTLTDSNEYKYIKDTPVYGGFMVWHLVMFMVLGPMMTWPMLMLLLLVFSTQTMNLVRGVRQETT